MIIRHTIPFFLGLFFLAAIGLTAQNNSGYIIYESKMDIHKNLPPEAMAFKDNIPQFRTNHNKLTFTAKESMITHHKVEQKESESADFDDRRRRRRIMRMGGNRENDIAYKHHETGEAVSSRNIFDRQFLVEGAGEKQEWKFTGEQKQVGSYLCQKAILQDTVETYVWFTPMIPVSIGPKGYDGLPGAILYVDEDNGTRVITATEIVLEDVEEGTISRPTEGKRISQEEFQKLREEKMQERAKEFGGRGGNMRIFRSGR